MKTMLAEREVVEQVSPEESERRLIHASRRYIRGEMSVEDFEASERRYNPDYRSVLRTLAERQRMFGISGVRRFAEKRGKQFSIG